MKTHRILLTLAVLGSLIAGGAAHAAGKIYIGAKLGVLEPDQSGFDRALNTGVYGGYALLGKDAHFAADLRGGTLSAEGEATLTVVDGDAPAGGEWDATVYGLYAAYRHPLTDYLYLKGKAGMARYNLSTNAPRPGFKSEAALSLGFGAGWKVGPGSFEVDLSALGSDFVSVSAGFHMSF